MQNDREPALAELRRAADTHRTARDRRTAAILAARATGATYRAIAEEVGLAASRVHTIARATRP